uniref:Tail fiber protein n=1 Tax=Globodera pallida TaxID=36090 RepID=A0A183CB88_GLOPA
MPVTASASYVMTPLKNGVIGVSVSVTASYVMTPLKNGVIGVIGVSVSVMTSSPDDDTRTSRKPLQME